MPKLYYFYLIIGIAVLLVVVSCVKYDGYDYGKQGRKDENAVLSVEQARAFFEKEYLETVTRAGRELPHVHDESCAGVHGEAHGGGATVTGSGDRPEGDSAARRSWMLNPGEFVPLWVDASAYRSGGNSKVTTPVNPEFRFRVERVELLANGNFRTYKSKAIQRIYTVMNDDGQYGVFIQTLVPDKSCRSKGDFPGDIYCPDSDFSGIVLYQTLAGSFVLLDVVRQGRSVETMSVKDYPDEDPRRINDLARDYMGLISAYTNVSDSRYELGDVDVLGCKYCLQELEYCICDFICIFCGKLGCYEKCMQENRCPKCLSETCKGTCDSGGSGSGSSGGGSTGGSSGGGSTGGGTTGGNSGTGSESGGNVTVDPFVPVEGAEYIKGKWIVPKTQAEIKSLTIDELDNMKRELEKSMKSWDFEDIATYKAIVVFMVQIMNGKVEFTTMQNKMMQLETYYDRYGNITKFVLAYNENYLPYIDDFKIRHIVGHEGRHFILKMNPGWLIDESGNKMSDHQYMEKNPKKVLELIYPNKTDEWYEKAKWAGICDSTTTWFSKSTEEQIEIREFLSENGIPYSPNE